MNQTSLRKEFFSYVIPSVLSFALSGVYAIVDGFFVGNSVGDAGITAINLVYPLVALILSLGTGIGMGSAVQYSIRRASGHEEEASRYAGTLSAYLLLASILLPLLVLPFLSPILRAIGAAGVIQDYGRDYLLITVGGAVFQIFGTGLTPLVRNNKGASVAMAAMVGGFLTNILLDWLFVWVLGWGVAGAAFATVLGQAVTAFAGLGYLVYRRVPIWRLSLHPERLWLITKTGFSSFGITLCPNISLFLMNLFLMRYGGNDSVACYAVVSYASCIVYLILQGVGDGCQPLMSDYYGKGDPVSLKQVRRMAYVTAEVLSVVCFIGLYLTRHRVGILFGASEAVNTLVGERMFIILIGFLFLAVSRVTTAAFYATEQALKSTVLIYAEILFLLLLLLVIPPFGGEISVWWSMSLSQILAMVVAVGFLLKKRKKGRP